MDFQLPPRLKNNAGKIRSIGFEIEFSDVSLSQTADLIVALYGGRIFKKSDFEINIVDTKYGTFGLELDSSFLKENKHADVLKFLNLDPASSEIGNKLSTMVQEVATQFVPTEVVAPPIPITEMKEIENLRKALCEHKASGTQSHFYAAFGMQFNPEVPDFEAQTLTNYLRAFFILYDWIFEVSEVDMTRRVLPYINAFPQEYVDLVVPMSYKPDLKQFMSDYIHFNPTRNRPLDLLPLFAHIDHDWLFKQPIKEPHLVKARPTFHYRLPNSNVDDANWRIAKEWNNWVYVERLAFNQPLLTRLSQAYVSVPHGMLESNKWRTQIDAHVRANDI